MIIELHISSLLHRKIPVSEKNLAKDEWELSEGIYIQKVLEILHLKDIPVILMLNGRQGNPRDKLKDGDVLKIFGVLAGG